MGDRRERKKQVSKNQIAARIRHFLRSLHGEPDSAARAAERIHPAAIPDSEPDILQSERDYFADEPAVSNDSGVNASDLRTESQSAYSLHNADWRDAGAATFKVCEPFRNIFKFPG